MSEKTKVVFIVNPKAGITPKSKVIIELVAGNLMPSRFVSNVRFTESQGHATEIAREALANGVDMIVAAGGDGTVNEVATAMVGSPVPLGILPAGSGNGLARCLKIPMSYALATHTLIKGNSKLIDVAEINNRVFVSIAGIGFDAHVADRFAGSGIRGLPAYAKIILSEYRNYEPSLYSLEIDGEHYERQALMISFANSNQFGFHARIAPDAVIDDGILDVCVLKPLKKVQIPWVGYKMLRGNLNKTSFVEYFKAKNLTISGLGDTIVNIDGEPVPLSNDLKISIKPRSLRVIVP